MALMFLAFAAAVAASLHQQNVNGIMLEVFKGTKKVCSSMILRKIEEGEGK